jgi:hypothetical protein
MTSSTRATWLVPTGLILLSFIPVLASAIRIAELAGAAQMTAENGRFFAMPVPIVVHVISGSLFSVLGAFQFSPGLRRRRHRWHRTAGWLLIPLGLAAALSALWMTGFYPLPLRDSDLLNWFRFMFGSAMVVSLVLGAIALRRRDFARHGAWMTRGYAIGVGAGTQALTLGIWTLTVAEPDVLGRALLHGASWAINLAVAEWVIRRRRRRRSRPMRTSVPALARSL